MKTILAALVVLIGLGVASMSNSKEQKHDTIVLTEDNHILFSGVVNPKSVALAQVRLANLSARLPDSATIYLIIDSPGGSVSAGNQFIDFAQSIPQKVKTLPIFAASMGYHMSQSFQERLAMPSSTLMSHRASLGGVSGQIPGEIDSRLNNIRTVLNEMDQFVADRIGIKLEQYKKDIHDELWLTGREAVSRKHADRLVKAVCDKSLMSGTRVEEVNTIFGPVQLELSRCPLITGPLSVQFGREVTVPHETVMKEVLKVRRGFVMEF